MKIIPLSSSLVLWRNFVKFAILAEFAGFIKSPLRRYPSLELNRSSAKFRQIRHSRRIRRIRQNRRFTGTRLSSSIALRRNFVKFAILTLTLIFAEISSKLPNSPLRAFLDSTYLTISVDFYTVFNKDLIKIMVREKISTFQMVEN